jgi:hypothetical protein
MKISIELTDAQVKGIKAYIQETNGVGKVTKEDIKQEVSGVLFAALYSGALGDYILDAESGEQGGLA